MKAVLDKRVDLKEYLAWSTVVAVLMFVPLRGTFQLGYIIIIFNSLVLLAFGELIIHRTHIIAILALAGFSSVGAFLASTPLYAPASQILGIGLLSTYFFCILAILNLSLDRWIEIYVRASFLLAVVGLIRWGGDRIIYGAGDRLTGIYSEPSYYVYVTLPAVGYCANLFVSARRYGWETIIFVLSYALADSALGFLGLLLMGALIYRPRLKGWQLLAGACAACAFVAGLYTVSVNIRERSNEMVTAIAKQDLSGAGNTTFAFLSNVYVVSQSFKAHPFTGLGIGGYANAYDKYIAEVTGVHDLSNLGQEIVNANSELNRDDAASMFLRVTAELGIPGLAVLIGFLIICGRVNGPPYSTIRNAVLPYLIVRMARMGHYFTVELYFFVGIYLLNYLNYCDARRKDLVHSISRPSIGNQTKPETT